MVPPGDRPSAGERPTSTFVLIHGAWHGGWCWERVAGHLRQQGHTVLCPDLPGHGADKTPPGKVTMRSCAGAVEALLEGLEETAVLVGHSLGGAVVSQACENRPERIRKAAYVSAFLLKHGESVWRHESPAPPPPTVLSTENLRLDEKKRTLDVDPAVIPEGFYNGCSAEDIADAMARWRPEPLAPMVTALTLTEARFGSVPRVGVACEHDRVIPLAAQQHMFERTPCEEIATLNSGHSPFLSHSDVLADLLEHL